MLLRAAVLADIPVLRTFEQGVIEAERPFSVNLKTDPVKYYDLEQLIEDTNSCLMVAEQLGEIIACGYARVETNKIYLKPNKYTYLGFMYVSPGNRGKNLISKILVVLVEWSNSLGIKAYKLDVYTANEAAISAYKKFGFKPNMMEMWKEDGNPS